MLLAFEVGSFYGSTEIYRAVIINNLPGFLQSLAALGGLFAVGIAVHSNWKANKISGLEQKEFIVNYVSAVTLELNSIADVAKEVSEMSEKILNEEFMHDYNDDLAFRLQRPIFTALRGRIFELPEGLVKIICKNEPFVCSSLQAMEIESNKKNYNFNDIKKAGESIFISFSNYSNELEREYHNTK